MSVINSVPPDQQPPKNERDEEKIVWARPIAADCL
jgi:hypothetical protein